MEAGIIAVIVISFIGIGAVIYMIIEKTQEKRKGSQGILNVDYSDPVDGPYLFLELKVPIVDVISKKQVIFDVNMTNYVSQK